MRKLQSTIAIALILGLSSAAFAGTLKDAKKDAKSAAKTEVKTPPSSSKTKGAVIEWFHFNGSNNNPADLNDPSKYAVESSPTCPTSTPQYRCDIKILSMQDDQTQPDLSQPIQAQRNRTNP